MISLNHKIKTIVADKKSWLCVGLDMNPELLGTKNFSDLKDRSYLIK